MKTTECVARVVVHHRRIASTAMIQLSNSPPRRDPSQPRPRDLAACFARGLILKVPPSLTEGAGNAGCALHPWPPVQKKSTGVSNQGYTASAGIPCTMVLRLIRALPGDRALLPPSPRGSYPARLSASVGAPGPHDFAVRDSLIRRANNCACGYRVHRIPLPTSVTIAKRSSCGNGTATNVNLIWGHREAIYFCSRGWTGFRKGKLICPSGSHTTHHIVRRTLQVVTHDVATSSLRATGSRLRRAR
jgi:hypothetical protein